MKERKFYFTLAVLLLSLLVTPSVFCQDSEEESEPMPPARELSGEEFITRDGVRLYGTYYASTRGKEAVPVMLIQDWNEDRRSLQPLAQELQQAGCAVVTLDVRGQGESIKIVNKDGREQKLDKLRVTAKVAEFMVKEDIEIFKRFLNRQNDVGALNVQKLCIVGVGTMGSYLATAYATSDLSWGIQGSDVKMLCLISPRMRNGVLPYKNALSPLLREVTVCVWFGKDDASTTQDCKQIVKMYSAQRPGENNIEDAKDKTLFSSGQDTKLQGLKLLGMEDRKLETQMKKVIVFKLQKKEIFWKQKVKE